jgi:hypothetical protein
MAAFYGYVWSFFVPFTDKVPGSGKVTKTEMTQEDKKKKKIWKCRKEHFRR